MAVFKVAPRPRGMPKQVVLARFEPLVAHFGTPKIPTCLENGPFCDGKRVQSGSKTRFSKNDPGPFGMHKQVIGAHLGPVLTRFGPSKAQKALKVGRFGTKNGCAVCWSRDAEPPRVGERGVD